MNSNREPILVNEYERVVDDRLASLCERYGARVFAKVGIRDVLPIRGSGLSDEDFGAAFTAHFDFVVADTHNEAVLVVEFDEAHHRFDPKQLAQDQRKNRICEHFLLPYVRAGAASLRKADHRTLLEWLIEVYFEHRRLTRQRSMHQDSDYESDPPEVDPDEFSYRTAYAMRVTDETSFAPLDAFANARDRISNWCWTRIGIDVEYDGWTTKDQRGAAVGHVSLRVGEDAWLLGTGRADLRGLWTYVTGVVPELVAQDIALLDLARKVDQLQRRNIVALSGEGLNEAVAGCERMLMTSLRSPTRWEQAKFILATIRNWGVDTDDPGVRARVYLSLDEDEDEDDDRRDAFDFGRIW